MEISNDTLRISMFGRFSIQNQYCSFPQKAKKSAQVCLLLEYLIANRSVGASKEKLIEVLWPDESSDNPSGALRNLVYRARNELNAFFPNRKLDSIILRENMYSWNNEIDFVLDTDEFDHYYDLFMREVGQDKQFHYGERLLGVYRGEFLPESMQCEWVMSRNIYYKRLFCEVVQHMCEYLMNRNRYKEVIALCEHAYILDSLNEQIHKMKLEAYIMIGDYNRAVEYYYDIIELFYSRLDIDISDDMKELYSRISAISPSNRMTIAQLENSLKEEELGKGAFFCNYDVFKNFYRVSARGMKRNAKSSFITLLSLKSVDDANIVISGEELKAEMDILKKVIVTQLRKNDIFSQFSDSQFSVILAAQNIDNCQKAISRIFNVYQQRRKNESIILSSETKQIS